MAEKFILKSRAFQAVCAMLAAYLVEALLPGLVGDEYARAVDALATFLTMAGGLRYFQHAYSPDHADVHFRPKG